MFKTSGSSLVRSGLLALALASLAGCGGGGGGGDGGGGGGGGTSGLPNPDVTTVVSSAAAVSGNDTAVNPGAAFSVLQVSSGGTLQLPIVSTSSPPKLNFTVFSDGAVKTGLTLSNISVAIAKLVPGTNGAPDQWVNYIYRTESTASGANNTGPGGTPALASALQATTDPKPAGMTDQLVYNPQGYYTYTFSTDIRDPAFNANNVKTNGVVFEPDRTHRVALQLSYTNAAGQTVRVNPYYDFKFVKYTDGCQNADGCYYSVQLTNPATETRIMADVKSCNTCHNTLALHGGGRVDVQYCVMCHNEGTVDANSGNTLDMRNMVHKIHAGHVLKNGLSIWGFGSTEHNYSEVGFPQDLRNCNKCHSNTPAEGNPYQTAQGDNWKTVPSRRACGSCHDGIDFTKPFGLGNGKTMNPDLSWANYGHVGGEQADDSKCSTCHSASAIAGVYHMPVAAVTSNTVTTYYAANDNRLPAGAHTVDYDIQSVSLNGSRNPVMVFRILQNNARMDFRAASGTTDQRLWTNFVGGPSVYFAYSIPQDGVTTPADFNAYVNAGIVGVWNGSATGTSAGTLTGPDSSGYYTLTLTGRTIPADASLLTGALGYGAMYQTNVSGFERTCADTGSVSNCANGLNVTAQDVSKTATGFTARRITAEADRCNNCHGKLGLFTETTFHSGQRNDPKMCAMCHNPNRSSSGWSADSTAFVHGIHGASKRTVAYNWHSVVTLPNGTSPSSSATLTGTEIVDKFGDIGFPGRLANCENCHAVGGYDFSAGASQVANRLHRTAAQGTMAAANTVGTLSLSPYVTAGTNYTSNNSNCNGVANCDQPGANLVNSPIANACFACHDGETTSMPGLSVKAHIESNGGGSIYQTRTTAMGRQESCLLCHGPSGIVPIKSAHGL